MGQYLLFSFGPLAVSFAALPARVDTVLSVVGIRPMLVVTSRQLRLLGSWPFLTKTFVIPADDVATRVFRETRWEVVQTGPSSAASTTNLRVTIPTPRGEELVVSGGLRLEAYVGVSVRSDSLEVPPGLSPLIDLRLQNATA